MSSLVRNWNSAWAKRLGEGQSCYRVLQVIRLVGAFTRTHSALQEALTPQPLASLHYISMARLCNPGFQKAGELYSVEWFSIVK